MSYLIAVFEALPAHILTVFAAIPAPFYLLGGAAALTGLAGWVRHRLGKDPR